MVATWRWPKASYSVWSICESDRPRREARVAVDVDGEVRRGDLLVRGDVLQAGQLAHVLLDDRRPVIELRRIGRGQRVLVLGLAEPAADIDVLARLHEELHAGHLGHLGPQPLDDLLRRGIALAERLELDEHARGVLRRVAAGRAHEARPRRPRPDPSAPPRRARWRGRPSPAKEMSCRASAWPKMKPVSCSGKKPLGMTT